MWHLWPQFSEFSHLGECTYYLLMKMKKVGVCWSIFFLPQNIARGKSKIKILLSFLWAAAIFIFFFSLKSQEEPIQ